MKDIYSGFFTLEDYLKSEVNLNKSQVSRELVEYLINKIVDKPEIKCMIQERGDKAIIFVPVSLIEEGKAEADMQNKNIITVWYLKDRINIQIEDRNNKVECFSKEDISDKVLARILIMYEKRK
jgi:hypothetical protein